MCFLKIKGDAPPRTFPPGLHFLTRCGFIFYLPSPLSPSPPPSALLHTWPCLFVYLYQSLSRCYTGATMSPSKGFILSKEMAYARYRSGSGYHRRGCQTTVNVSHDHPPRSALQSRMLPDILLDFHSANQIERLKLLTSGVLDGSPSCFPAGRARLRWKSIRVSHL